MLPQRCPSCCSSCASKSPLCVAPTSVPTSFSISNFLPAGVIDIAHPPPTECNHKHEEDGWHSVDGDLRCSDKNLTFLLEHQFIYATCRLSVDFQHLVIRIYIVPHDLPNFGGRLRQRDEAKVMSPARRMLKCLLPSIKYHSGMWNGDFANPLDFKPFLSHQIDNRTMAGLYGDLPSPDFPPCQPPGGMRSQLYDYQRRSVAAMIHKEASSAAIADPLYIPLAGLDGTTFYLQPGRMEIIHSQPRIANNRGGILCEELGTGKTVMTLALVLSTLDELPAPEEPSGSVRHLMTPLAFRSFPGNEYSVTRKLCRFGSQQDVDSHHSMPSLVELLLHKINLYPRRDALKDCEDALQINRLSRPLHANIPFYVQNQSCLEPDRAKRNQEELGPRIMYLSAATLIIVPRHLLSQWWSEILKHCEDEALRVFMIGAKISLPPARVLASQYDLILMTHDRFSREAAQDQVDALHSLPICSCPTFTDSRVPDCRCDGAPGASPFLQIRWKRLVIDEGHVSANIVANLTSFAKLLSVERRWIITGTPTANLLGLSFGKNNELAIDASETLEEPISSLALSKTNIDDSPPVARQWTSSDRQDLRKLASMVIHFLGVSNFAAEPKLFDTHVIAPLFDKPRPCPGAIEVLNQVMASQMIRHRIEDVESEVALPPITKEEVLLDLDPYVIKSYNVFQTGIATNAIDSERTDVDYMFNPKNSKALLSTIANMSQLMFWFVSDIAYNIDNLCSGYEGRIKAAAKRTKITDDDRHMLTQCGYHIKSIQPDALWRKINANESVPFLVSNLPTAVFDAWTRTPGQPLTAAHLPPGTGFMHPDRLIFLRNTVLSQPLICEEDLVQLGKRTEKMEKDDHDRIESMTRKSRILQSPSKEKGLLEELHAAQARQMEIADESGVGASNKGSPSPPSPSKTSLARPIPTNAQVLTKSVLAGVRIHSSASSKLNYILNEVAKYATTEKFLIFSQNPLSLYHISEAFELMQINYLQLTSQVSHRVREDSVTTFETSDKYRVLLMDLKHGARGLNLVTASRVIFCEPIWQADVESQAIKRVHRIGQTRPVTVKTLIIRNTAEHYMLQRRNALKDSSKMKAIPVHQENSMRDFIAHPKFISEPPTRLPTLNFPLLNLPEQDLSNGSTPAEHASVNIEEPERKKARVTFADNLLVSGQPTGASRPPSAKRVPIPPPRFRYADPGPSGKTQEASSRTAGGLAAEAAPLAPSRPLRKRVDRAVSVRENGTVVNSKNSAPKRRRLTLNSPPADSRSQDASMHSPHGVASSSLVLGPRRHGDNDGIHSGDRAMSLPFGPLAQGGKSNVAVKTGVGDAGGLTLALQISLATAPADIT